MKNVTIKRYISYCYYLFCMGKTIVAYLVLHLFMRKLLHRNIWLIREKRTEARDNGYHLYKYIRTEHPEIEVYYVITKDSADYKKVSQYGKTVRASSFMHYIMWLAAKYSISSQQNGAVPDPTDVLFRLRALCRKGQKVIFLKHGIQKDEQSHEFDYQKTGFSLVCCTTKRECDFIRRTYGYPKSHTLILGLCRFDNLPLNGTPQKQILIMPTFRSWLTANNREKEATDAEKEKFLQSSFYCAYSDILSNKEFLDRIGRRGYKIVFYMHYSLQSYVKCFEKYASDIVIIANRKDYDVQQLLIDSSILVTDFSSIFFDFAYMGKPEVFYQFDENEYRKKHYHKGYFDYREDGFGPVITASDELIEWINDCVDRDAQIESYYFERINSFFDFRDNHNCERTFNAIIELK